MAYSVVCISSADGAMGEEIGPLVADGLGLRLVNEQIVAAAAKEADVNAYVVANVEQRRSLIARVIEELPAAASGTSLGFAPSAGQDRISVDDLRGLIRSVIEEIASAGGVVIVSHAASHALSGRRDTLRVLVTAGPDTRRARIKEARGCSDKDADKTLARGDANRADYIKRFYGVSRELPTHYDIVLNSDRLSVGQAVDIIVRAASADA